MKRVVLLLLVGACANTEAPRFGDDPSSSSGGFVPDASTPSLGCSAEAKLVYVLSEDDDLWAFNPDELGFRKIGHLDCPGGINPYSMAVDRGGTAWVNTQNGQLVRVSIKDASCSTTTFAAGQSGFTQFGMAFASNSAGSMDETLYVSGISDPLFGGPGLGKIDLATLKVTPIGDYPGILSSTSAELTGTGDGKLYGFFTTIPDATLARIEKTNAQTSEDKDLSGVSTGTAFAFSFWGGDFWFYTSPSSGTPSSVTRLKASGDGLIQVVKNDVGGFRIVGAGVSTCAPTAPIR